MGSVFDEYSKAELQRKKKAASKSSKNPSSQNSSKSKQIVPGTHKLVEEFKANAQNAKVVKEATRLEKYEIAAILKKIDDMKYDLDQKVNTLYEVSNKAGMNPEKIILMAKSSLPKEFNVVLKTAQMLKIDIKEPEPEPVIVNSTPTFDAGMTSADIDTTKKKEAAAKLESELTKEQKRKFRGVRQKWIPIK